MLSNDITSHTTDGSALEEENNNITPILLDKKDDSSSAEHLDDVYHLQEENVLPRSLSESQRDAFQMKPHDTNNIVPNLSASSSSSSSVSQYFDTLIVVQYWYQCGYSTNQKITLP